MDISDPLELPKIGSLDLTSLRADREANRMGLSGDHELITGEIPMSPRATSEQILMTPRSAMGKKDTKRAQFVSAPELHGEGPVAIASNGEVHASIGVNGKLALWDAANSKLLCQVRCFLALYIFHPVANQVRVIYACTLTGNASVA